MNIYLVGFMGTGKTAVGKALAKELGFGFADLDDLIEAKEGLKIVDIFAKKGESYFRDLESKVLKETSRKQELVAACGGGIVLRQDNLNIMHDSGAAVCLEASPEVIYRRTKDHFHRPLLNVENPQAKIKELLDKRVSFYAKIKNHIDTSDLSIEEVVDKINKIIQTTDSRLE